MRARQRAGLSGLQQLGLAASTSAATQERTARLAPSLFAALAIEPPSDPPEGAPPPAFLALLQDLANLKVRVLTIIVTPIKGAAIDATDKKCVDHVIALLHNAPPSAANAKDLIYYACHLFRKFWKLPTNGEPMAHLRAKVPALLGGGALFSRQRNMSQRIVAHTLAGEAVKLTHKHLPLPVVDEVMGVFAAEMLNEQLTVQARCRLVC